jgi:hypothetical protein
MSHLDSFKIEIENELDSGTTIGELLDAMSQVCAEKADHVLASWQDSALAALWDRRSRKLGAMALKDSFQ